MKRLAQWVAFAVVISVVSLCPASAQYAVLVRPTAPKDQPAAKVTEKTLRYGGVGIYPLALFRSGGIFGNGTSGTRDDYGGLLSADFGVLPKKSAVAYELGGWYWSKGTSDLYEMHGRVVTKKGVGFQLGYLQSTHVVADSMTAFLTLNASSARIAPGYKHPFDVELGLGALNDFTGGTGTVDFTMYIQGSIQVAKRLRLTATHWYIRDRGTDLSRLTVGLAHGF